MNDHLSPSETACDPTANEALYSEFADDPDMVELVEMFVSDLPDRVRELQQAIQETDVAAVTHLSHQLKGAAGGYGFTPITEAAAAVEQQAKSQADAETLRESVDRLIGLCNRATSQPK